MDIILEVLEETMIMLPMLLIMYFILEYLERNQTQHDKFIKLRKFGPLYGAILGIIPQCGISVIASILFLEREISIGTLISVYIATSDEAIPLLLSDPSLYSLTFQVIILKFILAVIFGYLIDHFIHSSFHKQEIEYHQEEHSLWKCVVLRTIKVYLFIVIVHIILSYLFEWIGEEQLSLLLLNQSFLQPVISSIFGLIPHCVVSVILTQLYSSHLLSFASLISGLMSNAGLGLLILVKYKAKPSVFMQIIGLLLVCSIITGIFLQIL